MFISLQHLELRTVNFDTEVPAGEIEFDGKLLQSSPLKAKGSAQLISHSLGEIRVHGSLSLTVNAPCDRCLETADLPLETNFDLVYVPVDNSAGPGEKEIDQGAIEVGFYEGPGIELNDVLREVALLALPMQVVCNEDCKGICHVCGQNRNQQDCDCHPELGDDRWNQLKSLKAEIGHRN